jgi:hypothetical protein
MHLYNVVERWGSEVKDAPLCSNVIGLENDKTTGSYDNVVK